MFSRIFNKSNSTSRLVKKMNVDYCQLSNINSSSIYKHGSSTLAYQKMNYEVTLFPRSANKALDLTKHYEYLNCIKKLYHDKQFNNAESLSYELVNKVDNLAIKYPQNIYVLKLYVQALTWKAICLTGGSTKDSKNAIICLEKALSIKPNHGLAKEFLLKNQLSLGQTPPGMTILR